MSLKPSCQAFQTGSCRSEHSTGDIKSTGTLSDANPLFPSHRNTSFLASTQESGLKALWAWTGTCHQDASIKIVNMLTGRQANPLTCTHFYREAENPADKQHTKTSSGFFLQFPSTDTGMPLNIDHLPLKNQHQLSCQSPGLHEKYI